MTLFIFILNVYLFTQHYHKKHNKSYLYSCDSFKWVILLKFVTIVVTFLVYSSVTWLQAVCKLQLYIRKKASQVTYVSMVPRVGNETLRPLGVATGNALSVTRSEDTYVKTPPVGRRQPMTSLPACHNISAAGRIHHQLLRLKLASEAWPEA